MSGNTDVLTKNCQEKKIFRHSVVKKKHRCFDTVLSGNKDVGLRDGRNNDVLTQHCQGTKMFWFSALRIRIGTVIYIATCEVTAAYLTAEGWAKIA